MTADASRTIEEQMEFDSGWEHWVQEMVLKELGIDYFNWLESLNYQQEDPCSAE